MISQTLGFYLPPFHEREERLVRKPWYKLRVIIGSPHESLDSFERTRGGVILDCLRIGDIFGHRALHDFESDEFDLFLEQLALADVNMTVMLEQPLEDRPEVHFVFFRGLSKDQDVVEVNGETSIC